MTDLAPGPGWWIASDGKWYPPELHPSVQGSRPAPASPPGFGTATATDPWPTVVGEAHDMFAGGTGAPPRRDRSRRRWGVRLIPVGAVIAVAVVALAVVALTSEGASGWTDALHVVGSPVAAGNAVLVLNVNADHQLELSGVNVADGTTTWTHPFSASEITPGVAFGPTVLDDTVLALTPAGSSDDPVVKAQGLDVTTGKVEWTVPQQLILTDAPVVCAGGQFFCLAVFLTPTTTGLVVLNPSTGSVIRVIPGPNRNMAVAQPGSTAEGDLWQTNTQTPTLEQTSSSGRSLWTQPVASLFGGSQYSPNYGWDFLLQGPLDVGSIGTAPTGATLSLSDSKTLGISAADGSVKWTVPGYFLCGGGLQFLAADVVCQYSGTAVESARSVNMSGVSLTLRGLDESSGTMTWSERVLGTQALSLGTNVAFADGTHLVVQLPSHTRVVLDVQSGATSPVATHAVFWCEQIPTYKVHAAKGAAAAGERVSSPVFRSCTAAGTPASGLPTTTPGTVGVRAGGYFVWPTPAGLRAVSSPS
jgi:hypothetical protein